MHVNIAEAQARLSELIDRSRSGETVVIEELGIPIAQLVSLGSRPRRAIKLGLMKDELTIPDDFDAPLPDDVLTDFEGRSKRHEPSGGP